MYPITPAASPTLSAIKIARLIICDPASIPLPGQDAVERNSLIAVGTWYNLLEGLLPEIRLKILAEVLFGFTVNRILTIAEYTKGKLLPEAWPALYKASIFLFDSVEELSECGSNLQQFRNFVEDAQLYGNKTLRQIFYGLQLVQKPKASITIEDGIYAGMIDRKWAFPDDISLSKELQQRFLSWLCEERAHRVVCLRWVPPQTETPNLLKEAVKHDNDEIVKQVCTYMTKYRLHEKVYPHHPYKLPLQYAVINNNIQIVQYLLDEIPNLQLDGNTLAVAAEYGDLPMVELLIKKGAEIDRVNANGNTPLQVVIESFIKFYPFWSPETRETDQEPLNQLKVIIFLLRQYQDIKKELPFSIRQTFQEDTTITRLFSVACYLQDQDAALWLARFILEHQKDKNLLDIQNAVGKALFMHALKANHYPMYAFLQEQQAKQISGIETTPLSLDAFQVLRAALNSVPSTRPPKKQELPAPSPIQNTLPVAQPLVSHTLAIQPISWLYTSVHALVDLPKYLLTMVFLILRALYTFCVNKWETRPSRS